MKLILHNITHHHCPVAIREKVSFTGRQRQFMLRRIRTEKNISEAVILETCNRIEFYICAKKHFDCDGFLTELIRQTRPNAVDVWRKYRRQKEGLDVVRHLFEVAAGLDSQMIGENQILSQVKSAYSMALDCRTSKFVFNRLFHKAFRVGKAVRTGTNINCGAVSVGLAAVALAKRKIKLPEASAMIIGAGENAELVAKCLLEAGLSKLIIANRSKQTAKIMTAGLKKGQALSLSDVTKKLKETDLLISSTAAAEPVVTYENVRNSLAKRKKPLLIIDIAVPRDIDSDIGKFKCVSLYNIDDLNEQISRNKRKRRSEIPKARAIVEQFTENFSRWYDSLDLVPVIARMTQKGIELAHREAERYAKDFGSANREKLKLFAESLIKKILHKHISFLKNSSGEDSTTEQLRAADLVNRIFFPQEERS